MKNIETQQDVLTRISGVINELTGPFTAKKTELVTDSEGDEVYAIELSAPLDFPNFQAYFTCKGEVLFENTCEHPAGGPEGIHVAHGSKLLITLGHLLSVIEPMLETLLQKDSNSCEGG